MHFEVRSKYSCRCLPIIVSSLKQDTILKYQLQAMYNQASCTSATVSPR